MINEPATLAGLDLPLNIASGDPTGLLALVGRSVGDLLRHWLSKPG